jgi:amidohydrolase
VPDLTAVRPAEPQVDLKTRLAAAVEAARAEIVDLSHRIHADPEPAFEEHQAATWIAETLREHGFEVEHPAGSLATAIRATRRGGRAGDGSDGPRIGILAEYDALPGLGHGCGHNTMAASGVGAAIALAAVAVDLPGEIVFLGTPAEERGSGKQIMIDDGLFAGIDAALLYHPCDRNHVESHPLASEDIDVVFSGLQSHAAADPWRGRNALDALITLFSSVGLWRQQLKPSSRVHGIIREGGTAANIIPDRASAWFMLRSDDQAYYEEMKTRFTQMCEAAALATGTTVEVTVSGGATTMRNNQVLVERFRANMAAYGIDDMGDDPNAGSTDMANVSWVCPTIHPELAICDEGVPGHSILFRDAAATPRADETTLLAATLVAQTAVELFCDPELVEAAWAEFRST